MAFSMALTQAIYVFLYIRDKEILGRELLPAASIAVAVGLPKPSVVKILRSLHQAGIVTTGTGVNGGARLAPGAEDRNLADLFLAIEGQTPIFRTDHEIPALGAQPALVRAKVGGLLEDLDGQFRRLLGQVKLAEILPPPSRTRR